MAIFNYLDRVKLGGALKEKFEKLKEKHQRLLGVEEQVDEMKVGGRGYGKGTLCLFA